MRVLRYRLWSGSGGAGRFLGGEGIERDLLFLEDVTVSLITERRVSRPWGLQGGEPGAPGENWVLPGGYERLAKRLPDKVTIRLKAGDVLRMLTPGGGGWGPASARQQAQLGASLECDRCVRRRVELGAGPLRSPGVECHSDGSVMACEQPSTRPAGW
jgi:N-methylhydantoinase B/oxoprolinase/acetone carboxylase alpha subunit